MWIVHKTWNMIWLKVLLWSVKLKWLKCLIVFLLNILNKWIQRMLYCGCLFYNVNFNFFDSNEFAGRNCFQPFVLNANSDLQTWLGSRACGIMSLCNISLLFFFSISSLVSDMPAIPNVLGLTFAAVSCADHVSLSASNIDSSHISAHSLTI